MHNDGISHSHVADCRADFMDPPGILVTECIRQGRMHFFCPLALNDMQVGATQTCATDSDKHIKRTSHFWFVHLIYGGLFVIVV